MEQYITKGVILAVLIVADVVTGLASAFYRKEYNSSVMREGAYHKACEVFVVLMTIFVDKFLPMAGVTIGIELNPFIVVYFAVMEICSIIENVGKISPDAVRPVAKYFDKLKEEYNSDT